MNINTWRGRGAGKYRVLKALEPGHRSADDVWQFVRHYDVGYQRISTALRLACKDDGRLPAAAVRTGRRMHYRYSLTEFGRAYLAETERQFQPSALASTCPRT